MKSPIIFLRSAFAVAAITTGIFVIDGINESSWHCQVFFARECGKMLGYTAGTISGTLFFISGATWKFGK
tara:strand:+ start:1244 stop:1453 length:210 start_codon:yes stop_codon:yes gene_type:complete